MELVLILLVGAAGAGVAWTLFSLGEEAAGDFRKAYRAEGNVSLSDMWATFPEEKLFDVGLIIAGVLLFVGLFAVNVLAGAILAAFGFVLPRLMVGIARDQRRLRFGEQLLDGLGLLSNSVRAGMTLPQAVELLVREMKPPITQEFGRVLQEHRLGTEFDDAMLRMARRLESRDLDMLVNATKITRESGGNIGEIFEKISQSIRERARIEGKVRALSATGKMQAVVMSSMPFGIVVILYFMDPQNVELLFTHPMGLLAVGVVLALMVAAFFWISATTSVDI